MLRAKELKEYVKSLGIPACGICDAEADASLLALLKSQRKKQGFCEFEEENLSLRTEPKKLMSEAKSILVCLFPYYRGDLSEGNISRYAMIPDYHKVIRKYLEKIAAFVREKEPGAIFRLVCDTSPLSDRRLAQKAGLGFFGKNHLLIHPTYGSYCFIGSLLLSVPLEADSPMEQSCASCDACQKDCPGGALFGDFGYDYQKCISYLTQKKELSPREKALLSGQESVYGCDLCQSACPHNQNIPDTPIREFYETSITRLQREDIASMSGRAFQKEFAAFAFSWCKKQTILKNFTEENEV